MVASTSMFWYCKSCSNFCRMWRNLFSSLCHYTTTITTICHCTTTITTICHYTTTTKPQLSSSSVTKPILTMTTICRAGEPQLLYLLILHHHIQQHHHHKRWPPVAEDCCSMSLLLLMYVLVFKIIDAVNFFKSTCRMGFWVYSWKKWTLIFFRIFGEVEIGGKLYPRMYGILT